MLRNFARVPARWNWLRMCSSHAGRTPQRQLLPADVVPKHYRVHLEPDLEKFSYTGNVEIDVDVKNETSQVSVNVNDLLIKSVELDGKPSVSTKNNDDAESITWGFSDKLSPGSSATLKISFDGTLNDKLVGFYRSIHKNEQGKEHVVATTQMEPTDCRRAFPCFDEPSLKATFDIEIVAEKKYTVLSNSDVKTTKDVGDGKVLTTFNTTPKMSTYLVAFVVGEFDYVESNAFRVPIRAYATPGLEKRCQFSVDLAAKTLKFFEDSFGIPYPLPKMDMVVINDFNQAAMENWGLVTYDPAALFYVEGKDSADTKNRVAEVVMHELAHQWFGNLVTMDWWDGLWLNEGFATWMSWHACDHFFPEWKVWETYVSKTYQGALQLDGLRSSHPIQVPIQRADEVDQIFDAISYFKGSCVIRMVSQYLGEDVFMKGISLYLKRHAYGNTTTEDLWNALSEASGKEVSSTMGVWTQKIGYPLVTVDESPQTDKVKLTQNRYLETGDVSPSENETIYPLWLEVRENNGKINHGLSLTERTGELNVGEFYKLNGDQNSIFRVHYPPGRVAKLAAEGAKGDKGRLTPEDRAGLISDMSALAAGYAATSPLLSLIESWKGAENNANVWTAILQFLSALKGTWRFDDPKVVESIRQFMESIVVPKSKEVGWKFAQSDTVQEESLKSSLFGAAVGTGNEEFVKTALNIYAAGYDSINPNLRGAVFAAVSEHGTAEQWNEIWEIYASGTNGADGTSALASLGRTKDLSRKKELLDGILTGKIRSRDGFIALKGAAHDKEGMLLAWRWFQDNWDALRAKFPPEMIMLPRSIAVFGSFSEQSQLDEVEKFFAGKDITGLVQPVNVAKDNIRVSVKWLERARADVADWLTSKDFSNADATARI